MRDDNFDIDKNFVEIGGSIEANTEFLPLMTTDEEEKQDKQSYPDELSILPLRNNVLFPGVVIPITIGRDKSIKLIQDANKKDKIIGVISQVDSSVEAPEFPDLHKIGTIAQILRVLKMPDGNMTAIIQGKKRFKITQPIQSEPYLRAEIQTIEEEAIDLNSPEIDVLFSSIREQSLHLIKENPAIPNEASFAIGNIESPKFLINFISSNMEADVDVKQRLLEELNLKNRAFSILEYLHEQSQIVELKKEIHNKVRGDLDKQQRDYFLNQQLKTIQEELGDNSLENEINNFIERAKAKNWDDKVERIFQKEINKLQRLNPHGPEYGLQVNYLETLLDLPWNEYTIDEFDLKHAQKILDRDHYGLEDVKKRILEYLAVLKLKNDMKSPILCFYGPPGVGKTSLGKSIAEALGRKYVRMSLGGLHDESEIRGHRKTYIGAMPGRIIHNIKKAETSNPVFVLDEIDKLGQSNHGDPSSALLEVLDPEQNNAFYDNYLETEYDLSKVMFIATANSLSTIQGPLRDRMEIIEVSGYTLEEKIEIAKNHLIPKQLKEHGITKKEFSIDKKNITKIVEEYTRESGVRSLDKMIAKLVRNRARQIVMEEEYDVKITSEDVTKVLGIGHEKTKYANNDIAGVVTGLAWTAVGGDILFIESSITKGKGKLTLTGNLGDVMKESAVLALEYLKAHSHLLDLKQDVFDNHNIHIHVPEGATPKDGPSAGITMLTSLASLFTQRKVKKQLAMTGEITLRGEVLPVGGIKEKILAAKRASIKEIILCDKNKKDIEDIKDEYLQGLTFHYVNNMKEVLEIALTKEKASNPLKIS